jgi:tetratricopeptide (TPR) repeat protein
VTALTPAMHRAILCVDVEGFGDHSRTNPDQLAVRDGLYRALRTAFAMSGVRLGDCYHEDRGDGVLLLVPPTVPKNLLVTDVPKALAAALDEHNRAHEREARIRLRLAIHAGEVHRDEHGVAGTAINFAFRLLEAERLKQALAASTGVLAMIASQWFFEEVIRHCPASAPASYWRADVVVKETTATAWICLPDDPHQAEELRRVRHRPSAALPIPRQLPADTAVFIGREADLTTLDGMMADRTGPTTAVVSAIAGGAGVGKTTLALHWAHRVRKRFPDGELFANLRGYDPSRPMTPLEALDGFLRALDIPATKIPFDLEARAALFRSLLAERRMLVVLDNAANAEQVRPLLPGTAGCFVVITSRSRLSGLAAREGAGRIALDVLPADRAVDLLRQVIGGARVDAEPRPAAELARLCAYLPLALRITADRAAAHPHLRLADLADELVAERDRLDALATGDDETTAVRAVFSWSYKKLPADAARAFRLLGLHAGSEFSTAAAAALTQTQAPRARRLLDALAAQHLLAQTGRDRYRFHDLLHVYAKECAEADEPAARRATAERRIITWYLHTAAAGHDALAPLGRPFPLDPPDAGLEPLAFTGSRQAIAWCEAELANLVAATRHAAEIGEFAAAWKIPAALAFFFDTRQFWAEWITTHTIGVTAAQRIKDRDGEALLLIGLGDAYRELRRFDEALRYCRRALDVHHETGDPFMGGMALGVLGTVYRDLRRLDEALDCYQRALALLHEADNTWAAAWILGGLGDVHRRLGRLDEALDHCRQALALHHQIGDRWVKGWTLLTLGEIYRDLGRLDEALDRCRQALTVHKETGDRQGEALALVGLGEVLHQTGQVDAAETSWREALIMLEDLGSAHAAEVRARLGAT